MFLFNSKAFKGTLRMAAAVASGIENGIRTTALTKGIRPSEFFLDYDRLRSGYVTGNMDFYFCLILVHFCPIWADIFGI